MRREGGQANGRSERRAHWVGRLTFRESRGHPAAFVASVNLTAHDTFRAAWKTRTAGVAKTGVSCGASGIQPTATLYRGSSEVGDLPAAYSSYQRAHR